MASMPATGTPIARWIELRSMERWPGWLVIPLTVMGRGGVVRGQAAAHVEPDLAVR